MFNLIKAGRQLPVPPLALKDQTIKTVASLMSGALKHLFSMLWHLTTYSARLCWLDKLRIPALKNNP